MRYLLISAGLFLLGILATVLIIEGLVYGDELEQRQISAAERASIARLMDYHGADCVYERDGAWWFDRGGKRCRLETREPKKGATHDTAHH